MSAFPFYLFFMNLDENSQNNFQHKVLNNLFTQKLLDKEKREYLDKNVTELTEIRNGIFFLPQWRTDIMIEVIYLSFKN